MEKGIATVRWHLQRIPGVTSTWFEWSDAGDDLVKNLVVEVDFDTDPNAPGFRPAVLDAIDATAKDVMANDTTMVVSHLKIIPRKRG